jgi:hypothetical protein
MPKAKKGAAPGQKGRARVTVTLAVLTCVTAALYALAALLQLVLASGVHL